MSYVKCAVCGIELSYVNAPHLRKHGLTVAEYRQRYPEAPLMSLDYLKKQSVAQSARVFHRVCSCGRSFETRSSNGRFCQRCSRINKLLLRKKWDSQNRKNGTLKKSYLEITPDGRVKGAVLLEKGISINSSGRFNNPSSSRRWWSIRLLIMRWLNEFDYLVFNGKIYCGECGSPIIIARENEHYTIPTEPCCKSCGLVYQLA